MATHTGTDLYTCSICNKPYRFSSSLALHRKKEHNIVGRQQKANINLLNNLNDNIINLESPQV